MIEEYSTKTKILMQLYFSTLSEKDRRRYAAIESLKLGRGGIKYISMVLAVDTDTIAKGRKELTKDLEGFVPKDRQRREGGGRKKN